MFNWIKEKASDFWHNKKALSVTGWVLTGVGAISAAVGAICGHQESSLTVKEEAIGIVKSLAKKDN